MANILDVFNNNLCNSEVGFIISGFYMRSILDCSDTIMEYYKDREPDIADLDGYIDYLFLIKAIGLKREAEYALSNDDKAKYAILVDDLNEISAKYKRGDELKYINSNISIIH